MPDIEKTNQTAGQNKSHLIGSSGSAQRRWLLDWMRNSGPIDTLTARRTLNILMPASRIKELKNQGYAFHTRRITITDEHGRSHSNIALYTLIGEPAGKVAA
ncbi:hypothetical protein D3C84_631830 [compost metagenome]